MKKEHIRFLLDAKKNGYAGGEIVKEPDGSYSSGFVKDGLSFKDNWDGGEPFGGRERFMIDGKPYWMMVYFGAVEVASDEVIPTLRAALSQMPEDFPARGPKEFRNGEFVYLNEWHGGIDRFEGREQILHAGAQVYRATYAGGLVDVIKD